MPEPLENLIGAYRAQTERGPKDTVATRLRLMRSAHRHHQMVRVGWATAAVLVITLSNATTWAWSTGRVDRWLGAMRPSVTLVSNERSRAPVALSAPDETLPTRAPAPDEPAPDEPAPDEPAPDEPAPDETVEPVEPVAEASEPNEPVTSRARALEPEEPRLATAAPVGERTLDEDTLDEDTLDEDTLDEDTLDEALLALEPDVDAAERRAFQQAHERHFAGDYPNALSRWNGYLIVYPNGRFTPEAEFNRAIALLHVGRVGEARDALGGFASRHGPHRTQAQRLIEAIDEDRLRLSSSPRR